MDLQKLLLSSKAIAVSSDVGRLAWGLEQILLGTKTKCFWSAMPFQNTPRSGIVLFPARVAEASITFEKGRKAKDAALRLEETVAELTTSPIRYIPCSEGRMVLGWEIRLGHKANNEEDGKGLPVAIVLATLCPAH